MSDEIDPLVNNLLKNAPTQFQPGNIAKQGAHLKQVQSFLKNHVVEALAKLYDLGMSDDTPPSVRRQALVDFLAYGLGRPVQQVVTDATERKVIMVDQSAQDFMNRVGTRAQASLEALPVGQQEIVNE